MIPRGQTVADVVSVSLCGAVKVAFVSGNAIVKCLLIVITVVDKIVIVGTWHHETQKVVFEPNKYDAGRRDTRRKKV